MGNFENNNFLLVPVMTVLVAFLTAIGFIFFINHATSWMQVHNITSNMRMISEKIIMTSIANDMEQFKVAEAGDLKEAYKNKKRPVATDTSGYLQLVSFPEMIKQAKEDDIIIEFHESIGNFSLFNNPLFSYWGPGANKIDEELYKRFFVIGHKETEIQDANSAMSKLAEVAIKSMGNDDPRSAINAVHQLADLMRVVDKAIAFTPYLADSDGQVRIITQPERFENFLYRGFGMIRHYAKGDLPIITEIITSMRMLAQSSDPLRHNDIWNFAENTVVNIASEIIYDIDKNLILEALFELAEITNHNKQYEQLKKQITGSL